MDIPLAIPSAMAMDYFTPLHVDTNIEYALDMDKFPELADPLRYSEPALVIDSNRSQASQRNVCMTEGSEGTVQEQMFTREAQEELFQLIDSLEIDIPESDILDDVPEVKIDLSEWKSFHSEEEYCAEVPSPSQLTLDCMLSKNTDGFHNTCVECNAEFLGRGTSCHRAQVLFSTQQVQLGVNCDNGTTFDNVSETEMETIKSFLNVCEPNFERGMTIPNELSLTDSFVSLSKSRPQLDISTYTSDRFLDLINGDSSCSNRVGSRQW